jgi:hypothetical protein
LIINYPWKLNCLAALLTLRNTLAILLFTGSHLLFAQDSDQPNIKNENLQQADSLKTDSAGAVDIPKRARLHYSIAQRVLHRPTWHVGLKGGFNFDYFSYAAQKTSRSEISLDNTVTSTASGTFPVYETSPGVGLIFGVICHPYISDYAAVGIHADGVVGTTPMVFSGGGTSESTKSSKYSDHVTYFYGHLNYGIEATAGFAWLKFLISYDHSLRHTSLTYFQDAYSSLQTPAGTELTRWNSEYKIAMELRHEELTLGLRLFPYSKDKLRIKNPCLLDLAYTLNRDYDFAWSNSRWNYHPLNDFYHGARLSLWVQSRIGLSLQASFPKTYFKVKDAAVDTQSGKTLPFLVANLFYNLDFFGLGYR